MGLLRLYALSLGLRLQEDRRTRELGATHERRNRLAKVIVLSLGAGISTVGLAETGSRPSGDAPSPGSGRVDAGLAPGSTQREHTVPYRGNLDLIAIDPALGHEDASNDVTPLPPPSGDYRRRSESPAGRPGDSTPAGAATPLVARTLRSHLRMTPEMPSEVLPTIDRIARYYAQFPEIVELIEDLAGQPWQLVYKKQTWVTTLRGNRTSVLSARVHFDFKAAAQVRFNARCSGNPLCIISPADALLHELLHVHEALGSSEGFVLTGGINGLIYPHRHETEIIDRERRLFRSMTATDGRGRPSRSGHRGRMLEVSCVLCVD